MLYLREFEFYEDDGYVIAEPFGLGAGTFGDDFEDALDSAADYMRTVIEDLLIDGKEVPKPSFGNKASHNGRIVVMAVDCDLARVDAVSAADAARMLGVSRARVTQMCKAGLLQSWRDGGKRLITRDSVKARLREKPSAGRPRKSPAIA